MLIAHRKLITLGTLPESRRAELVDRPFKVRRVGIVGHELEGRAFAYKADFPVVEIGGRKYTGLSWVELAAAVERGAVVELSRLRRVR